MRISKTRAKQEQELCHILSHIYEFQKKATKQEFVFFIETSNLHLTIESVSQFPGCHKNKARQRKCSVIKCRELPKKIAKENCPRKLPEKIVKENCQRKLAGKQQDVAATIPFCPPCCLKLMNLIPFVRVNRLLSPIICAVLILCNFLLVDDYIQRSTFLYFQGLR